MASVLKRAGYKTIFKDYQTYRNNKKLDPLTFSCFLKVEADIIGISVQSGQLSTVLAGIAIFKKNNSDKTIILGGPSALDTPLEIIKNFPVDFIIIGEGEKTIVDLMRKIEAKKTTKR